ncbi:hypothetical protein SFOMI_1903 [Sphingobium fuliginis]|uniref:Uncharacterized protein n=1 Tax=Sphingobium fuliginis (strain ATCC 27551) TaxID=336203 RepID=A0A292ZEX8_SPHSA|nr:hypothetical protein SFOMI_1903 [Sphingobium fuliginis]
MAENVRVHRHFVNRDRPDATRTNDQNLAQFNCSIAVPRDPRESAHIGSWRYSAKSVCREGARSAPFPHAMG